MPERTSERTATVQSFLRFPLRPEAAVEELCAQFKNAHPFPHLVLDHLFPAELLDALLDELPPMSSKKWVHLREDQQVKSNLRSAVDLGERGYEFASFLHSAGFLYFLTEITGIRALLPDPYLSGGGYHLVPSGGKFDIHADRNMDHNSGLERRLAMLIYLNRDWRPECRGELELWNLTATQCEQVIEPIFNRTVIFEVGDKNFHGVRPVAGGQNFFRKAFAVYFHTVGRNMVFHNSLYAPPIYRDKVPLYRRIARETLPPLVTRALKGFKNPKY